MAPSKQPGRVCCSGQQAHAGGREAGATPLWKISSLRPTDLLFGAVFNGGASMSFARDREKPLKRQAFSAFPVEHPRWVPGAEDEQKVQIRKGDELGVEVLWETSGSFLLLLQQVTDLTPILKNVPHKKAQRLGRGERRRKNHRQKKGLENEGGQKWGRVVQRLWQRPTEHSLHFPYTALGRATDNLPHSSDLEHGALAYKVELGRRSY